MIGGSTDINEHNINKNTDTENLKLAYAYIVVCKE